MNDDDNNVVLRSILDNKVTASSSTTTTATPPTINNNNKKVKLPKNGDVINVYVSAIFPQSQRFKVTTDPNVNKGTQKEKRLQKKAQKRLSKLLGDDNNNNDDDDGNDNGIKFENGDTNQNNLVSRKGEVMKGIIKAKSKTGQWCYVQPINDGDVEELDNTITTTTTSNNNLPIGIAFPDNDTLVASFDKLKPKDIVSVRLEGIDEKRGQLAMTLLHLN